VYLEIELTLVKVEPESQLDDACGAHPAPEDVLYVGCKTLLKDPKQVTSHQLLGGKENTPPYGRKRTMQPLVFSENVSNYHFMALCLCILCIRSWKLERVHVEVGL
jgi:hypothetical protein